MRWDMFFSTPMLPETSSNCSSCCSTINWCQGNGNKQLKSILPGSKPSTPAAASFFASLGQFTFKSKAQNQRTRPLPLRTHCSKDWIVKLPISPADPTCEQSAGLETTKRDRFTLLGWGPIREQIMAKSTQAYDHHITGWLGRGSPLPRSRFQSTTHCHSNTEREPSKSLDVGGLHSVRLLFFKDNNLPQWQLLADKDRLSIVPARLTLY